MRLQNILTVLRKDLRSQFDHPSAYIVMGVFVLLLEFLFFRAAFLIGEASLRSMLDLLPWLLIFVVPAITMGSIAQERAEGTLELLLTHPLKERELLLGKFLAALSFMALSLLPIFFVAISFSAYGRVDSGVVVAQYLASLFLSAALISLGLFVSSLLESPVASLLVSAALSFLFIIVGFEFVTASVPWFLTVLFSQLSLLTHFSAMARGAIDIRDVWYFLSFIVLFLGLTYLQLLRYKFGSRKSGYHQYQLVVSAFIVVALLSNLLGIYIPGRLDLTQDHLYTLTGTTKTILAKLPQKLDITLYASHTLPAQFQPVLRDTRDLLRDYVTYGKGKITLTQKDPSHDESLAQEAVQSGVRQTQFNVLGQGQLQVQSGFFGIVVGSGDKKEVIPFIQDTSDLEFQLTSYVRELTRTDKKRVAFLTGHGEHTTSGDYGTFGQNLSKQFDVSSVGISKDTPTIPSTLDALVIAGPKDPVDAVTQSAIQQYMDGGGSVLFLIDSTSVEPQSMALTRSANSFADFLYPYGVGVKANVVYDLRSNATVNFNTGGFFSVSLPYPFWAHAALLSDSALTSHLDALIFPWASSLTLNQNTLRSRGLTAVPLLGTTQYGGTMSGAFVSLNPEQKFPQTKLGQQLLAVSVEAAQAPASTTGTPRASRIIVVGSSNLFTDQYAQNSPQNFLFGINAVSWLTRDQSLGDIQAKQLTQRKLLFGSDSDIALVKYGNMVFVVLLLLGVGAYRMLRRRGLRKFVYASVR